MTTRSASANGFAPADLLSLEQFSVGGFNWSPDSTRLALLLRDPTEEELEAVNSRKDGSPEPAESGKLKRAKTQKPWVIDRLQFKVDEVGYLDRRRTHIYIFALAEKSLRQITSGDYDDAGPSWSPDGKLIAFTSNRSKPDPDATYNKDIWTVAASNLDKGAHPTQVTTNPGDDSSPAWSPDGQWIASLDAARPQAVPICDKAHCRLACIGWSSESTNAFSRPDGQRTPVCSRRQVSLLHRGR